MTRSVGLLLLSTLVACKEGAQECDDSAAVSVVVTLTDASGGEIPAATVTYDAGEGAQDCTPGASAMTWNCGYEVAGDLQIVAQADGFYPANATVTVAAGECHVVGESIGLTLDRVTCDNMTPGVIATVDGLGGEMLENTAVKWRFAGTSDEWTACDEEAPTEYEPLYTVWDCAWNQDGELEVSAVAAGHGEQVDTVTVEGSGACSVVTEDLYFSLDWLED